MYPARRKVKSSDSAGHSSRPQAHKTYLFFALVGSSILFLSLVFMYLAWSIHNEPVHEFRMPKAFILSTVILLLSSFTLSQSQMAFREDEDGKLLFSLAATLVLGLGFACLQILGWYDMQKQGFYLNGQAGTTLLYIISGLHLVHIALGLVYLFYLNLKAFDIWNDPVKALLYFSNQEEQLRLSIIRNYWHFMDGLWMILFFGFLFSQR